MKDHATLQKHIPELHRIINESLTQAGLPHVRVHSISFTTVAPTGCPGGVQPVVVCHKRPDGTLVCENVCP